MRRIVHRRATERRALPCFHPSQWLRPLLLAALAGIGLGGVRHESAPHVSLLQPLGSWPGHVRGPAWDIALSGHYAYVALGDGGLLILDVSNPAQPVRAGEYLPGGRLERVRVVGTRAYLGTRTHRPGGCGGEGWRGQVQILDIQDPVKPVLMGRFVTSYEMTDFCVDSDRLYLGDTGPEVSDFYVVDVHDPAHPVRLSANVGTSSITSGCGAGDRLYAASWARLQVLNVSQPQSPVQMGESLDMNDLRQIRAAQALNGKLYLCGGDPDTGGFAIVDVNKDSNSQLSTLALDHAALKVQVQGNYAYLANAQGGLTILDVSDPTQPFRAGGWDTDGLALGIAVAGAYVYVADFGGGVKILNASDPTHITLAGQFDTGLSPRQCVVNGGKAYLLSGDTQARDLTQASSRLEIVDVQNPSQPRWLGTYQSTQDVRVVSLSGSLAYLAWASTSDSGLEIVDCSEPTRPVWVNSLNNGLSTWSNIGFGTSGERAYLAVGDALIIYDLKNPAKPVTLSQTNFTSAETLLVNGQTLYLAGSGELRILDVANPRAPALLGSESSGGMSRLWLTGGFIYAAEGWQGFEAFDVRQPVQPKRVGTYDTLYEVNDIWSDGQHTFAAESWQGVDVFDVSNPAEPRLISQTPTAGQACGITVAGEYVYVLESGKGLGIYQLDAGTVRIVREPANSVAALGEFGTLEVRAFGKGPLTYQWYNGQSGDTTHPVDTAQSAVLTMRAQREPAAFWVRVHSGTVAADSATAWISAVSPGSLELVSVWPGWRRGEATDVAVAGTLAYVTVGRGGLWIANVSNTAAPRVIGRLETKGYADRVVLSGQLAYVADAGLEIIDVSQPTAPLRVGGIDSQGAASKVALAGRYAYWQIEAGDLKIVEISDPTRPQVVGTLATGARLVEAYGPYACVIRNDYSDGPRGLLSIVAVTDPAAPRVIGTYQTTGEIGALAVEGTKAYLLTRPYNIQGNNNPATLQVIDLTQPSAPLRVGSLNLVGGSGGLTVAENRAYVGSSGLSIVDVSDPARPSTLGSVSGLTTPVRMAAAGGLVYAAVSGQGLDVFDVSNTKAPLRSGKLFTAGNCQEVALCGHLACLADGFGGIALIDVSTPTAPVQAGVYKQGEEGRCVAAHPDKPILYISSQSFEILDVSQAATPKCLGTAELSPSAIFVRGEYAYLNSGSLHVVDVRTPSAIKQGAEYSLVGMAATPQGFGMIGSKLCLSREWDGLEVLDLSEPGQPKYVASYLPEGSVSSVATLGDLAVIGLGSPQPALEVLDMRNPQQPERIGQMPLDVINRVALRGSYAFATGAGLNVVDIGDPSRPVRIATHNLGTDTTSLQVRGDLVYVAAGDYGMAIYRFTPQLRLDTPVLEGGDVRLSWLGGAGIRLQKSTSVVSGNWEDVPNSEGASSIRIPSATSAAFYRLARP